MISSAASVAIAFSFGLKAPLLAPAVFFMRFIKKEIAAFSYFLYCIFLCYEFSRAELDLAAIALILSALLLLEETVSERKREVVDYILAVSALLCILEPLMIIPVLLISILRFLWKDRPFFGIFAIIFGISIVYLISTKNFSIFESIFILSSVSAFLFIAIVFLSFKK